MYTHGNNNPHGEPQIFIKTVVYAFFSQVQNLPITQKGYYYEKA